MDRVIEYGAYALIILGVLVFLGMFVGKRLKAAARAVEQASDNLGDDICRHGVCPHECPSCRPMPPAMPGRVSADEIQFFASLARMEDELEAITEGGYRLPGERAS